MKSEFSKSWNSSKQPRKQVKFRANAPNHIKRTFMGSTLDKELRKKYGRRSIEVRKGDEVKVMRGKFRGKQGKVGKVDVKHVRVQIDGIQRMKTGGEKLETWFNPSNIKIIILDTSDARRLKGSQSKTVGGSKTESLGGSASQDGSSQSDEGLSKKEAVAEKKTAKKATKKKIEEKK